MAATCFSVAIRETVRLTEMIYGHAPVSRVNEHESSQQVTMDQWKADTPDVMDMTNLRPCAILEREGVDESAKACTVYGPDFAID